MQDGGTTRQTTRPLDLVLSFYGNGKLKRRRETVWSKRGKGEAVWERGKSRRWRCGTV